jgi:glycosyltransferase involved in cell wall biosynthesis
VEPTSVVVPARDAAATIGACVDALRRLDPPAVEVIVVDDASRDATGEIAARHGARVVRVASNVGPGLARNLGAEAARGRFLAFTDADCEVPPDWLAACHRGFDAAVSGVTGPYAGATHANLVTLLMDRCLRYRQRALPEFIDSSITANLMVERASFLAVGGFPAYRLPGAAVCCFTNEDEELAHLLVEATGKPLRWLRDNGVRHAYRPTLAGYFRQQAKYAEAILISYARFPRMLRHRTNYSRGGGVAQILLLWLAVGAVAAAALFREPWALLGLVPLVAVHAPAVAYASRPEPSRGRRLTVAAAAFGFLGLTALAWSKGLASGAVKAAVGRLSPGFTRPVGWRPGPC